MFIKKPNDDNIYFDVDKFWKLDEEKNRQRDKQITEAIEHLNDDPQRGLTELLEVQEQCLIEEEEAMGVFANIPALEPEQAIRHDTMEKVDIDIKNTLAILRKKGHINKKFWMEETAKVQDIIIALKVQKNLGNIVIPEIDEKLEDIAKFIKTHIRDYKGDVLGDTLTAAIKRELKK